MTPLESPETDAEFRYNLAHTMTHEIVDRTFRAIQTRFRCLDGIKGHLQVSLSLKQAYSFLGRLNKTVSYVKVSDIMSSLF